MVNYYKGGLIMTWKELWMTLFHTTDFLGVNIGFWFSMLIVFIIVLIMNVVFWSMPRKKN